MSPRQTAIALAALGALLLAPPARASFRCGPHLVAEGDSAERVLARCGKPAEVTARTGLRAPIVWYGGRPVRVPGEMIEVRIETWIYNFGPSRLMQKVVLEDGFVVETEALDHGHN